ncbi:organomercurial lyase [Streptomyces chiangmaiensis]|uniref:Organomercurial lyase n=1 Tax=Streptomyces chiangmaiensis TaxID=766497 RepID=A0ABU7FWS4_9ACTN|nr:organomercurial lyase [Streptomyces chiangmaiensis]MED7827988.1 organomercurial lyase [Streptomyces chiangmaiensis]
MVEERIARALDGRRVDAELVKVADQEQAARLGMTGSPTVLINGVDPFAVPGTPPSLSCRLYRESDGRVDGAPSVSDLREALNAADSTADCECPPMDAAGRGGRGRLAPVAGALRAVQQAVLRHFAATGEAPSADHLHAAAATHGRTATEVLADLAAEDFITLDDHGRIRAAYPFSTAPTRHRVRLAGGIEAWSMCAVDALGIPDMLGTDAVITSTDPVTGDTITVTSTQGRMTWHPTTAVVYIDQRPCIGPAADVACGALNFFTSPGTARSWAEQHPGHTGKAVAQAQAEAPGRSIFGTLLTASEPAAQLTPPEPSE